MGVLGPKSCGRVLLVRPTLTSRPSVERRIRTGPVLVDGVRSQLVPRVGLEAPKLGRATLRVVAAPGSRVKFSGDLVIVDVIGLQLLATVVAWCPDHTDGNSLYRGRFEVTWWLRFSFMTVKQL